MLIKICDNLIINTDRIDYIHNGILIMIGGESFRLNEIGLRNINKVSEVMEIDLFSKLNMEHKA